MRYLIPFLAALSMLVSACGGQGEASASETIATFKRQGIALQPEPRRDCPEDSATTKWVVGTVTCFSVTIYLGKGKPPPDPIRTLTPTVRSTGTFAVYLYKSSADASLAVRGKDEDTFLDPLFGKPVRSFRRANVVVLCTDCSKKLARIKDALNDL